jgi:hypothetical protein
MRRTTGPRKRGVMGRNSIFRPKPKDIDHRVQGLLTEIGRIAFEQHRKDLDALFFKVMKRKAASVSDADVIEYLARTPIESLKYLNKMKRQEDREALEEIPF